MVHVAVAGILIVPLLLAFLPRQSKLDFNAPSTESLLKSLAHYYKVLAAVTRMVRVANCLPASFHGRCFAPAFIALLTPVCRCWTRVLSMRQSRSRSWYRVSAHV